MDIDGRLMNMGSTTRRTYLELAGHKMAPICDAFLPIGVQRHRLSSILWLMMSPWGDRPLGSRPRILSDITDDHTPFEFSIAFREHGPEFRMLVESLPLDPLAASRWNAGLVLNRKLERQFGCSTRRFRVIQDLFRPADDWAKFAMWHAVNVGPTDTFKIYLNPGARGRGAAAGVVEEALRRLEMGNVLASLPPVRPGRDEVRYFSLDLAEDDSARVKVYYCHEGSDVDDVERLLRRSPHHVYGEAARFCRALGGERARYDRLPLQTCYSFVQGESTPSTVTLHFPVRAYVPNDQEAMDRIAGVLAEAQRSAYTRMVKGYIGQAPEASTGAQTYLSYHRTASSYCTTVYLSPNAYQRGRVDTSDRRVAHAASGLMSLSA